MKYMWKCYYKFAPKPTSKSELIIRWCRMTGTPYTQYNKDSEQVYADLRNSRSFRDSL